MKLSECSHIRLRNNKDCDIDVEEFIKSIEKEHKIDFRSLSQWKELIKRLHANTSDCKRRIQDANSRKYIIMSRIFLEATRNSPFELTDKLARTYHKWRMLESANKKSKKSTEVAEPDFVSGHDEELIGEISENTSTAHHNTEILVPELPEVSEPPNKSDAFTDTSLYHLPVRICVNQHKRISPLGSQDIVFDFEPEIATMAKDLKQESREWLLLSQTTSVQCLPKQISVTNKSPNEQVIQFSVINCTTEYTNIRFVCVTDNFPFKKTKIIPAIPKKMFPGIAQIYRFVFKLSQNIDEFSSALYFKVGRKLEEAPMEALCIPIISKFSSSRSVLITRAVYIPPAYVWQIKGSMGFPSGTLKICSDDKYSYHAHVYKRLVDISKECEDSVVSIDVISPNTASLKDRLEDDEIENQSKVLVSSRDTQTEDASPVTTTDIILLVLEDLIDLAFSTFIFDSTYILIEPHSKNNINLFFKKPERIGSHHSYYDIEFYDATTGELIMTKSFKVFAEVLPHPIHIYPKILDMSRSLVAYGICEDYIVITNTHKVYHATIQFKLTTKMHKLFCITPIESIVPAKSTIKFSVKLCSKDCSSENIDDFAHFTIKITVSGHKSIYKNAPPFFYEIIAPCASEFKKVYSEKYFKEILCEPFDKS